MTLIRSDFPAETLLRTLIGLSLPAVGEFDTINTGHSDLRQGV